MNSLKPEYIPLTFIKSQVESLKLIRNTIVFSYILKRSKETVKLGDLLTKSQYGYTASAQESGDIRLLRITDIKDGNVNWDKLPFCECSKPSSYILRSNDILVARTGGTTGKSFLIKEAEIKSVFASYLIRLSVDTEKAIPEFIYSFLNSYYYWSQIVSLKQGSAQPNVNAEKLKSIIIPICDVKTQKEILSVLNGEKSQMHNELLNKIQYAEEKFNEIQRLSSNLENLRQYTNAMKEQILQDAIQGKLVQQDPTDEDAGILIEKIKAEKEKLIKEGKIKRDKPLPEIKPEEISFEIPKSWRWVRLGDVAQWGAGSTPQRGNLRYWNNGTINWLKTGELNDSLLPLEFEEKITEDAYKECNFKLVKSGDVLIAMYGATIGKLGIAQSEFVTNQACCVGTPFLIDNKYLFYYLLSKRKEFINLGAGGAQPNISKEKIIITLIPLPPLSEQIRIVKKIEALISLIESLSLKVSHSKVLSEKLNETILNEVFNTNEED